MRRVVRGGGGELLRVELTGPHQARREPGRPAAGRVVEINRGAKRSLQSVVIRLDGDEAIDFDAWPADKLVGLDAASVRKNLIASGLWTAFRTRPFGRVPAPDAKPAAIFVTAIDTYPLAVDPARPARIVGTVALGGYFLALIQDSIWYQRSWATAARYLLDGFIYALGTAAIFAWLWP